jgi:hypothetical protein
MAKRKQIKLNGAEEITIFVIIVMAFVLAFLIGLSY